DSQGDELMDRATLWRRAALSVPLEFVMCENVNDLYWKSINLRESIGTKYATMYRSPVQRIFELAIWKEKQEAETGTNMDPEAISKAWSEKVQLSPMAEAISPGMVDASMTVWNRLLCDPECRSVVMEAESFWGKHTPWDSVYKLEAVVKKVGRSDTSFTNARWILHAVSDEIKNGTHHQSYFSVRMLSGKGQAQNKGACDIYMYRRSLKQHCISSILGGLSFQPDMKDQVSGLFSSHAVYRSWFGYDSQTVSRQWLHGFPKALQYLIIFIGEIVYGVKYDTAIRSGTRFNTTCE
ncbi:unnamed protein product, partial [Prorocentrum cordatum]